RLEQDWTCESDRHTRDGGARLIGDTSIDRARLLLRERRSDPNRRQQRDETHYEQRSLHPYSSIEHGQRRWARLAENDRYSPLCRGGNRRLRNLESGLTKAAAPQQAQALEGTSRRRSTPARMGHWSRAAPRAAA